MNYTIAVLEDVYNDMTIDFCKDGENYTICIHAKPESYSHTMIYPNKHDANIVFLRLTVAIIDGCYSLEERIAML